MALLFLGSSKCTLCGLLIREEQGVRMFPAFVANAMDPMFYFSDGSFHNACLEGDQAGRKAMEFADIFLERTNPENRVCCIDNRPITIPLDYLFIPLLTSDQNEKIFKYNFLTFNRSNISAWPNRKEFIEDLIEFNKQGKWKGLGAREFLDYLITEFVKK